MQAYAFYKQVNEDSLGHMQGICKGHASICKHMQAYIDICTHMQTYARHLPNCKYMHSLCKHMQSYTWYMLKNADTYRYMQKQQNICKHMHQACKQVQAYAFFNNKYANVWYYMQEHAKNMKKYA